VEFAMLLLSGLTLPYPRHKFAAEFVIQWLFLLVEPSRLFLGKTTTHAAKLSSAKAARHHISTKHISKAVLMVPGNS
jgi:hypothetical protein